MSVRQNSIIGNLAAWLFLLAVALAPLLFGGNVPLAWGLNAALLGTVLLLLGIDRLRDGRPFPVPHSWILMPAATFVLVVLWAFIQSVGWTPAALHHPGWRAASIALGQPLEGAISVNPSATRMALLRLVTAGVACWLALQIGRDPRWAHRIVLCVAVSAALYSVYGLAIEALGWNTVLWVPKTNFGKRIVTATFINPNSFAAYIGMGLLASLALLMRSLRRRMDDHGLDGARAWAARFYYLSRSSGIYSILLVPSSIALVMTGSRGGILLTALAALFMLVVELVRRRSRSSYAGASGRHLVLVAAAVAVVAGVVIAGVGDRIGKDFSRLDSGLLQTRLAVAGISLKALLDAPLTGSGYGTFADIFPLYRDTSLTLLNRWHEAHNAYIEALLELGIPAAILLFFAIGSLVYRCFHGALRRRRDHLAPVVAAAATILVGLHATIDFSIQLQGLTITYAALLGAGSAQSWSSRTRVKAVRSPGAGAHTRPRRGAAKGARQ